MGAQSGFGKVTEEMCVQWADDEKTGRYLYQDYESRRASAEVERTSHANAS